MYRDESDPDRIAPGANVQRLRACQRELFPDYREVELEVGVRNSWGSPKKPVMKEELSEPDTRRAGRKG